MSTKKQRRRKKSLPPITLKRHKKEEALETMENQIHKNVDQNHDHQQPEEGKEEVFHMKTNPVASIGAVSSFQDELDNVLFDMQEKTSPPLNISINAITENISGAILCKIDEMLENKLKKFDGLIQRHTKEVKIDFEPVLNKMKHLEKNQKSLKDSMEASAIRIESNIEKIVSSINEQSRANNELAQQVKEGQTKHDEFFIKLLPLLQDIKQNQNKSTKQDVILRELNDNVQKMFYMVKDIKDGHTLTVLQSSTALSPSLSPNQTPSSANVTKVFNLLTELATNINYKFHNSNISNQELKTKVNEINQTQTNMLANICTSVIEVQKNSTSDSKTLSQMNTALQSLKASSNKSVREDMINANVNKLQDEVGSMKESIENSGKLLGSINQRMKSMKDKMKSINVKNTSSSKLQSTCIPNNMDDLTTKLDKLDKYISEIPNNFGDVHAAIEKNLCINLETKIKDNIQVFIDKVYNKFDAAENKKYVKLSSTSKSPLPVYEESKSVATRTTETLIYQQALTELTSLCDNVTQVTNRNLQEVKDMVEKVQSTVMPVIHEVHAISKQVVDKCAREIVVEEQIEALADTVLKPINDIKLVQESILGLMQKEIKNFIDLSLAADKRLSTNKQHQMQVTSSQLFRVERRLSTKQKDCLQMLNDLKVLQEKSDQNLSMSQIQASSLDVSRSLEFRKLMHDLLNKIQTGQSDILNSQGSQLQKFLTDVDTKIKSFTKILDEIKSHTLNSDPLQNLGADLQLKLIALAASEKQMSIAKSQSFADLMELAQQFKNAKGNNSANISYDRYSGNNHDSNRSTNSNCSSNYKSITNGGGNSNDISSIPSRSRHASLSPAFHNGTEFSICGSRKRTRSASLSLECKSSELSSKKDRAKDDQKDATQKADYS